MLNYLINFGFSKELEDAKTSIAAREAEDEEKTKTIAQVFCSDVDFRAFIGVLLPLMNGVLLLFLSEIAVKENRPQVSNAGRRSSEGTGRAEGNKVSGGNNRDE